MTKKAQNSEVVTPTFEVVANESDKQSLINNLDNFDIIKINKNTKKDEKFEIFSDSVVRISSELIKDGLILNTATQLFKCDTPITQLMRLGDGYGSAIMSNGKDNRTSSVCANWGRYGKNTLAFSCFTSCVHSIRTAFYV